MAKTSPQAVHKMATEEASKRYPLGTEEWHQEYSRFIKFWYGAST